MLQTLKEIFELGTIEVDERAIRVEVNSHTPYSQGIFLQKIFDEVKPVKSLEIGLAYGISTLFILEKCHLNNNKAGCHIVIEPYSWGPAALHNINKENLGKYLQIKSSLSHDVLPVMHQNNERIQFAYIDTTKLFDVVLQDFFFIDKILDIGGVVIFDDSNSAGVDMVVRFVNTLPNYDVYGRCGVEKRSWQYCIAEWLHSALLLLLPFKKKFLPGFSLKSARQLGLDCRCIAFKKKSNDTRPWNWHAPL